MSYLKFSRRDVLKFLALPPLVSSSGGLTGTPAVHLEAEDAAEASSGDQNSPQSTTRADDIPLYPGFADGPASRLFTPLSFPGNITPEELKTASISERMKGVVDAVPLGQGTAWGIPFHIGTKLTFVKDVPVGIELRPFKARWLIFLHTSDIVELETDESGFYLPPFRGRGILGETMAEYSLQFQDGTKTAHPIRGRRQIGMVSGRWGENCLEAVAPKKPQSVRSHHEQPSLGEWGRTQERTNLFDRQEWLTWIWAWENPYPDKTIEKIEILPKSGTIVLSAITAGDTESNPLRWRQRQKALLTLPSGVKFDPWLDSDGLLSQIQLDLGQVISAGFRNIYPNSTWETTSNNTAPETTEKDIAIEFTSHPEAEFLMFGRTRIPVASLEKAAAPKGLRAIPPAHRKVRLRVVEKGTKKTIAVRLHVHGEAGEYLPPVNRHRHPNPSWFEDYSVDYVRRGHNCTYIPGEAVIKLPLGKVYIEVSKGFEIKPVRKVVDVTSNTDTVSIELEKVLPWREKGWVTADTHVHFLSPGSALLEGAGEGVNVVNLLASQWGELMTNVGDFDGKTTFGSREAGGDGEFLVRVGTENRQHVMGHISLLGYEGQMITPLCSGGPNESAIGDPIEVLLTEWARECKKQGGLVILPHMPDPRAENAAAIIGGHVDGVEIWRYGGINPYSLADWYRYLNCGYFLAAIGGTDKMSASTAVGTIRTYARIDADRPFDYEAWMEAVRRGNTFATYGPLMEFDVDGMPPGTQVDMSSNGGTVDVTWLAKSCTIPMTSVELVVNGVVEERKTVKAWEGKGHWSVSVPRSSWLAMLVRGIKENGNEIIAAHSSPVMVRLKGSEFYAAADALTILDQIEGAMAYLDTVSIRAEDKAYKRMRMVLESAHRKLHNRMHRQGQYHHHSPMTDHHDD